MKFVKTIFFFLTLTTTTSNATMFELFFYVQDSNGNPIIRTVTMYKIINGQMVFYVSGESKNFFGENDSNGACDIEGDNNGEDHYPDQVIWSQLVDFSPGEYMFVIGDKYIRYYIGSDHDLKIRYKTNMGFYYDSLDAGYRTHTFRREGNLSTAFTNITLANEFQDETTGGTIKLNYTNKNAPYTTSLYEWSYPNTATVNTPQYIGPYSHKQKFANSWTKNNVSYETTLSVPLLLESSQTYKAIFNKYFNVTIQNELPGYGNGGTVNVSGVVQTSPHAKEIKKDIPFSASGITQTINYVQFTFSYWKKNGLQTQETSPFTPTGNDNYTAVYTAKPVLWTRQILCSSPVNENIVITWNDHPNSYVTYYEIWRKTKFGNPEYLGNVNRGVRTFTDPDYIRTNDTGDDLLLYDVRAYYSPSGTLADPTFDTVVYGMILWKQNPENNSSLNTIEENEDEISIKNYPNPFNPSTTISYNIPEDGNVSLRIYDSIGRELEILADEFKSRGSYSVNFNGENFPSGIYYYILQLNNKSVIGKMLLIK